MEFRGAWRGLAEAGMGEKSIGFAPGTVEVSLRVARVMGLKEVCFSLFKCCVSGEITRTFLDNKKGRTLKKQILCA